jgi:hypothetical protein
MGHTLARFERSAFSQDGNGRIEHGKIAIFINSYTPIDSTLFIF